MRGWIFDIARVFVLIILTVGSTAYRPCLAFAGGYWDVDLLCNFNNPQIRLVDEDNRQISVLQTNQVKMLLEARDKIQGQAGTYAKLLLEDDPSVNAWAVSTNGQNSVCITLPMLDELGSDDDAMAALIGHELAHIVRRHGATRAGRNFMLDLIGLLAGIALDAKVQAKWGVTGVGQNLGNMGATLVNCSFSRDEERDADEIGVEWMIRAGYDPQGALRLHTTIAEHGGGSGSYFSTHPSQSDRIANIRRLIERNVLLIQPAEVAKELTKQTISPGQVGVVVKLKERHNYLIFSGTTCVPLPEGLKIQVVTSNNVRIPARVARSVEGYYSATVDGDIRSVEIGNSVEFVGG